MDSNADAAKKIHFEKIKRPSQSERKEAQRSQMGQLSSQAVQNEYHYHQYQKQQQEQHKPFFLEPSPDIQREKNARQYNGLMMQWEKELIAKIQISQLVSDDPYKDDFYYQIYNSLLASPVAGVVNETPKAEKSGKKNKKSSISVANRMQQQMQRLIDKRKQKKEEKTHGNFFKFLCLVALEGALGKISIGSSKNPKKLLEITLPPVNLEVSTEFNVSKASILKSIESVYDNVLELENLKRKGPGEDNTEWYFIKVP